MNAPSPGRLVLLTTSHRVAPGQLSWPAWQALHQADRVLCADPAHPQLPYLREAGVEVEVVATPDAADLVDFLAGGRTAVLVQSGEGDRRLTDALSRLAGSGRVAMPDLELLPGAYDLPGARLIDLVQVMDRIREECPWSARQTHEGLAKYAMEEAFELIEAIEEGDRDALREELGDVLLQVVFHARIAEDGAPATGDDEEDGGPFSVDDVAATLAVCREYGVPVVARGAGTSIAGQATGTGVVLDFTRHMNGLLALDPEASTARVQPGLILDRLRDAAAPHGLTFGPDPSTHSRCTLGGMIGNNSCGSHSVAWGTTADNVHALDVRTYRGTAHHLTPGDWTGAPDGLRDLVHGHLALLRTGYPELPRRISGYALDALLPERGADLPRFFCGTEGTLGLVTEATVRLVEAPPARALAVLGYADESAAAEAAPGLLPYAPLTVEGMAADLVPDPRGLPRGGAWLFVETGGATRAEARRDAEALARAADATDSLVVDDPAGQRALWRVREDASGTATRMPDGSEAWPGWEDCAVPPARLGAYLRDFRALLADHGLRGTPYGHFGDGCIHVRIDFDLLTPDGVGRFRRFSEELAALVVRHGGSLSGEHGDGMARAELLPALYGDDLVRLFGDAKDVWDPDGALNPGVLVRPAPLDADLR
ncbi:FAD-linked oxidase C-terminal domain-containing protein, partial [Streptomyces sp. McG2]|uniref:FAD-linked oxidase C-terminal domain-containing protein n=1 Tax=Streptomyces sp. McG2 TaxID=2725482 RepID=UPI0027E5B9EA